MRGIPDYLVCVNGRFVALELKRSHKEKMRGTLQENTLDRIHRAGGYCAFVWPDNWDSIRQDILQIVKGEK